MQSNEMPSLDVPTFAAPHFMPEMGSESIGLDELNAKTDELTESFEFPLTETPSTDPALAVGGLDAHFADAKLSWAGTKEFRATGPAELRKGTPAIRFVADAPQ